MNIKKNILTVFAALSLLAGFTACESMADYTAPEVLQNSQVYFSNTNPSKVNLNYAEGEQTFNVLLARQKTDDALSINLKYTGVDGDTISAPSSIAFAPGDTTVVIPIKYKAEKIGFENPKAISINIAEDEYTTPYGQSVINMTLNIPAPWESLGMATYREAFICAFYGVENLVYQVEIQQNKLNPGHYRLVNPYGKAWGYNSDLKYGSKEHYLEIHAENPDQVYISKCSTGLDFGSDEIILYSYAGYYVDKGKPENAESYYGKLENGLITFPVNSLLIGELGYKDGQLFSSNVKGDFMVLLPGYTLADNSVDIEYLGIFTGVDKVASAVISTTLGTDVTLAKAAVVEASADPEAVADAIAAGEIEATVITNGKNNIPVGDAVGDLMVVAVTLDGTDVKEMATAKFEYYGGGANPWKSLGMGSYTDDFISSLYTEEGTSTTFAVEILENSNVPGFYRLVDPYGKDYPLNEEGDWDGKTRYLEIDATDPECVIILPQEIGLNYGDGDMVVASWGGYLYAKGTTVEDLKKDCLGGTLKDGVITLPVFDAEGSDGSTYKYQGLTFLGDNGYRTCNNGEFKVVLPSALPAQSRKISKAKVHRLNVAKKLHSVRNYHHLNTKHVIKSTKASLR